MHAPSNYFTVNYLKHVDRPENNLKEKELARTGGPVEPDGEGGVVAGDRLVLRAPLVSVRAVERHCPEPRARVVARGRLGGGGGRRHCQDQQRHHGRQQRHCC